VAQELAALRAENARLLQLLKLTRTQAAPPRPAQAGFFEAPPGPVHAGSPAATKVALFGALFAARTDVHAARWENTRTGKAGWLPAVRGGWRKGTPCGTQIIELPNRCPDQQERAIRRVQDYRAPISSDQPTRITKKYPKLEL
jgi:hypothetical protein